MGNRISCDLTVNDGCNRGHHLCRTLLVLAYNVTDLLTVINHDFAVVYIYTDGHACFPISALMIDRKKRDENLW
ncbi:MAG: hypothetical protein ACFFD4_24030 [Candidatus Odinarchaeota archaeon]